MREAEEWEKEEEQRREEEYREIEEYVHTLSIEELREELCMRMLEEYDQNGWY